MPVTPAWWRRLYASTRIAAVMGAVAALVIVAPVSYVVLMMRSPGSAHGATTGAWVIIGIVVLVCATAAGAMTALFAAVLRRLWLRSRI
ncbi:MAG TPA: hypothetical protein VFJ16_11020 [Longimicrobium sp.]|nr:hypothetical protein [Longimicrobium sp.]